MLDFDGVILESAGIKTNAFRRLFSGYPAHVEAIVNYHVRSGGVSRYRKFRHIFENILKLSLSDAHMTELGHRFSTLIWEEMERAPFVPGAVAFLQRY